MRIKVSLEDFYFIVHLLAQRVRGDSEEFIEHNKEHISSTRRKEHDVKFNSQNVQMTMIDIVIVQIKVALIDVFSSTSQHSAYNLIPFAEETTARRARQ